jgi:hypothetical protein
MNIGCAVAGHEAGEEVYNSGFYFSACRRCGRHLVRSARTSWEIPPPGHRVVWKAGRHSHSLDADYSGCLPIVKQEAALPAVRSPFASWSRAMIRLERPARAAGPAQAIEESGDYQSPRLLLVAVVLGAGLQMLLSFVSRN